MSSTRSALLSLILIGAATRLVGVSSPAQVVFDEVHWGTAVNAYCCSGARIFDVHPPHAKLLITAAAAAAGYDGSVGFQSIGQSYGQAPVWAFRLVPALAGMTIAPLVFLLVVALGASRPAAWMAGWLVAFDNALILETRVMLLDGILVASTLGALVCLLRAETAGSGQRATWWRIACGAFAGLALGTKFTGLLAPGLIGLWLLARWRRTGRLPMPGADAAALVVAATAVYLGGWAVHFALLTQPGPADAFHATSGRFLTDVISTHRAMFDANARVMTPHPDASGPLSWPVMRVVPFFWAGPSGSLHLLGNPLVWWGSTWLLAAMLAVVGLLRVTRLRLEASAGRAPVVWFPLVAFAAAWVPYFFVARTLFQYHYFTALIFAVVAGVVWLDRAGWTRPDREGQRVSYHVVIGLAVAGFLLVSPLTFGFSLGGYDEWLVGLMRSWR
jgi:dolichyl-phosphate-mannose--protein O-mannosyl transferase